MNSWWDDYSMNYESLRFYLREHHRISNEEMILFFEDPKKAKELGKTFRESHRELHGVIIKVLSNLYDLIDMMKEVDLYKEEWQDIKDNEKHYTEIFYDEEPDFQEKYKKYGMIKYLDYYQKRYNHLFAKDYGENKKEIDTKELLL